MSQVGEQMPKTRNAPKGAVNRREEYAETTRRAAVDAARQLFREHGYFATTVNEIAAEARVSPATVYAVNGGKQGLLKSLIDEWSASSVAGQGRAHIEKLTNPREIVRHLTSVTRSKQESYGDIMKVVLAA